MMNIVCIFFLYIVSNISCTSYIGDLQRSLPVPPKCGLPTSIVKRSVGGGPTSVSHFPWTVFLIYDDLNIENDPEQGFCGGSLINSRYVLTAAHCIDPEPVSVLLGTTDLRNYVRYVDVDKVLANPRYYQLSDTVFDGLYDIGLIQLAVNVEFSNSIYPICLPFQIENYEPPNTNTTFLASGWGTTKYINYKYILTVVKVKLVDFEECFKVFSTQDQTLHSKVFCAGGTIGTDTCFKDSGSPVVREINGTWILEGIVSSGLDKSCGTLNPALYTKVLKYEKWIREQILNDFYFSGKV
uniref:Peptidase S1 domain-containing protein n=1 Tax=Megaselia scalaris TaxID=36166 RepID=T1GG46_MEGSC